uniref:Uncharacterized protein n=1 Tax=Octopus bimaculoides TaxID=37653 RepID=A0A0L8HAI2_OCTBM
MSSSCSVCSTERNFKKNLVFLAHRFSIYQGIPLSSSPLSSSEDIGILTPHFY